MQQLYGLIGTSLKHSFSKTFFDNFFKKENITSAVYENFELQKVEESITLMQKENLFGFNITMPFKQKIIPLLNSVDKVASEIHSVNCANRRGNKWVGYNTDIIGFERSIYPLLHARHKH